MVLTKLKWLSLSGLLSLSVLLAASNPQEAARLEYQRALDGLATSTTDPTSTASDSNLLRGYVLYPYVQSARLVAWLERGTSDWNALDQDIASWLTTQGNAPVTVELRRRWLLSLAARGQWRSYLSFYQPDSADAELRCHWLNAQLVEQGTLTGEVLKPVWLVGERLPTACNAPFNWARTQQLITHDWVTARARLALQQGNSSLARELLQTVPTQSPELLQWAGLLEQPAVTLDRWLRAPVRDIEPAVLQAGWQRLIRTDLDAALARLPKLIAAHRWNQAGAGFYTRELALGLSWSRRPEALRYFARVPTADMNDLAYEWQARAALWVADWLQVQNTIERMPTTLQTQARWRYWRARAQQQLNQPKEAQAGFQALMDQEDNYYAALAAAQLDKPYVPHPKPVVVEATLLAPIAAQPGMQRAAELVAVGQRDAAEREWRAELAPLSMPEKIAAARLAHDWGWYDQAITILAKLSLFDDYQLLYPQPYDVPVKQAAVRSGLPTALIYAVMRQETLFRSDARSSADARGLLQLLPTTARQVARQQKQPLPSVEDLYRPDINVPLGALYLKSLIDQFNGAAALGLAAYNAGPNAVRRWLPDAAQPMDVWIENIPYNETRTYVQRILWHRLVFDWLRHGQPVTTTSWLAQVRS